MFAARYKKTICYSMLMERQHNMLSMAFTVWCMCVFRVYFYIWLRVCVGGVCQAINKPSRSSSELELAVALKELHNL